MKRFVWSLLLCLVFISPAVAIGPAKNGGPLPPGYFAARQRSSVL